mgnify:CR=1 FL=1
MKLIDEFDIGERMRLRLQVGNYKGDERIDVREYIKVDNEYIPTKKGVNLNSEWVDKFIAMVDKLRDL